MRTENEKPLVALFPELPVLDPQNYAGNHFNESIIRASILRSANRRELEFPDAEGEENRRKLLMKIIQDEVESSNDLSFEIALASASHKVPILRTDSDLRNLIYERGWKEEFDFYCEISR